MKNRISYTYYPGGNKSRAPTPCSRLKCSSSAQKSLQVVQEWLFALTCIKLPIMIAQRHSGSRSLCVSLDLQTAASLLMHCTYCALYLEPERVQKLHEQWIEHSSEFLVSGKKWNEKKWREKVEDSATWVVTVFGINKIAGKAGRYTPVSWIFHQSGLADLFS